MLLPLKVVVRLCMLTCVYIADVVPMKATTTPVAPHTSATLAPATATPPMCTPPTPETGTTIPVTYADQESVTHNTEPPPSTAAAAAEGAMFVQSRPAVDEAALIPRKTRDDRPSHGVNTSSLVSVNATCDGCAKEYILHYSLFPLLIIHLLLYFVGSILTRAQCVLWGRCALSRFMLPYAHCLDRLTHARM